MDTQGPHLLHRVRTTGHRLFHRFGLYVNNHSLPHLSLNRFMDFVCQQGIAQRIKFASSSSLPSSSPLFSTPPSPSIRPPSPASLPTFPPKSLTHSYSKTLSPSMTFNTTFAIYGKPTTAFTFVTTPLSAHGVVSSRRYVWNACWCATPPQPILRR